MNHAQISIKNYVQKEENIIGVALDGKLVCHLPIDKVEKTAKQILKKQEILSDDELLNAFRCITFYNVNHTFNHNEHTNQSSFVDRVLKVKDAILKIE